MMPEWVPAYEAYHCRMANSVREQLLEASSATLDRLLPRVRVSGGKSRGTRPGTMLRQEIPIRGGAWQSEEAGWMEADRHGVIVRRQCQWRGGVGVSQHRHLHDLGGDAQRCMAGDKKPQWSSSKTSKSTYPFCPPTYRVYGAGFTDRSAKNSARYFWRNSFCAFKLVTQASQSISGRVPILRRGMCLFL